MSSSPEPADVGADPASAAHDEIVQRHGRLFSRTLLVAALTFGSRILGFVREVLSAALFGSASPIYDAFITAWRVPNLFRRFLGEGALSTALQTRLTEVDGDQGNAAGRRLFLRTIALVSWILFGLCAAVMLAVWLMPDAMPLTGWHWLGRDPAPVRELTLRLMPFVVLVCLAALCGGALQVRGHFTAPAVAPAAMNVVWILALLAAAGAYGWSGDADPRAPGEMARQLDMAHLLGWGVLAAGLVQLCVHVPPMFRRGLLRRGAELAAEPATRAEETAERGAAWQVLRTSLPLAFGAAVYQINVMIDGWMAEGLLRDGGPSAHYFANRVQQFPLALIAVAATSSVFPSLKALGHRGRRDELRGLHDETQVAVSFLALPAGFGLLLLATPISAVLFQHGAYAADGVARVAAALRMLALALLPAGAVGLVSRTYYALGDFRTPVRISVGMLVLNVALNTLFVAGFGLDTEGLALATALTSWGNLLLLLPGLGSRLGLPPSAPGLARRLARIAAASALAGLAAFLVQRSLAAALEPVAAERARSVPALLAAAATGMLGYLVAARLLGASEWRRLRRRPDVDNTR